MARSPLSLFLTRRLFSHPICLRSPPLAGVARLPVSSAALSRASVGMASPGAERFTTIRCKVNHSGDSGHSPLKSGSGDFSGQTVKDLYFPAGCDFEHWNVAMDKPSGEGATSQQMIDLFIQTAAKVVGSDDEAKKSIYKVVLSEALVGFGIKTDKETSEKIKALPGVLFVHPDWYVDTKNKDYGGELFVNGEIVQRPPESERIQSSTVKHVGVEEAGEEAQIQRGPGGGCAGDRSRPWDPYHLDDDSRSRRAPWERRSRQRRK